ncbi:MAG: ATPase, partial [Kiritimatiellia bacterium]
GKPLATSVVTSWEIALLAEYGVSGEPDGTLSGFLQKVFSGSLTDPLPPEPEDVAGFDTFFDRYHRGLTIERAALNAIP